MPLFRRKQRAGPQPPPDLEIPPGMVAVQMEEIAKWAELVVMRATELASTEPVPHFVDLFFRNTLPDVCGERAHEMADGSGLLAYNLRLHGYWCRAEEMRMLNQSDEENVDMEVFLVRFANAHPELDWYQTIQAVAYNIARDWREELHLAGALPIDCGNDFRGQAQARCVALLVAAVDAQHPGSSAALRTEELEECWTSGYWMRPVAVSLPEHALIELS